MIDRILEKLAEYKRKNILYKSLTSFIVCSIIGVIEESVTSEITPEIISKIATKVH